MQKSRLMILLLFIIFQQPEKVYCQDPYEYKEHGIRMEGRTYEEVSASGIELISFLAHKEEFDPGKDVDLKIRFFLENDTSLFITARELNIRKYYKMKPIQTDWAKGWQEFGPWPTKDVLSPLGLTLDELGVVGRIRTNDRIGSGRVAPLIIYYSKLPEKIGEYTLYFIPRQELASAECRLYMQNEKIPIQRELINKGLFGGVPFPIKIDISQQREGIYRLILDCRYKNRTSGPQRTYTFYHKPKIEL